MKQVYIESTSGNKYLAAQTALLHKPEWVLQNKAFALPEIPSTITHLDTIKASRKRAQRIAVDGILPHGSIAIGNHKGWSTNKKTGATYLLLAITAIVVGEPKTVTTYSRIKIPHDGIGQLIENGVHPYDAFERITGKKISDKTVPVYEIVTGGNEVAWMERTITRALCALE